MKKKFAFKLIALALAAATLSSFAACSNGGDTASTGDTSGDGSTDDKFAERVALDVCAFVGQNEADGLRSDPVSKYIEEQLNIDLYLTGVTESDWPNQLATMMAGQDLPDIFLLSNPTEQLSMLLASNSALNMSPYLEEYAPQHDGRSRRTADDHRKHPVRQQPGRQPLSVGHVQGLLG